MHLKNIKIQVPANVAKCFSVRVHDLTSYFVTSGLACVK